MNHKTFRTIALGLTVVFALEPLCNHAATTPTMQEALDSPACQSLTYNGWVVKKSTFTGSTFGKTDAVGGSYAYCNDSDVECDIAYRGTGVISMVVSGAKQLTFNYKGWRAVEDKGAGILLCIDGAAVETCPAHEGGLMLEGAWRNYSVGIVGAGSHTIQWKHFWGEKFGHSSLLDNVSYSSPLFEMDGGTGTVIAAYERGAAWTASSDSEWLSVSSTSGTNRASNYVSLSYSVSPYDEVGMRRGTITLAGGTFPILQYGRRMLLDSYGAVLNYESNTVPISVTALSSTAWRVSPSNSWISVVDAGSGRGNGVVCVAIEANPYTSARTGEVGIGTELFTITQEGRPQIAINVLSSEGGSVTGGGTFPLGTGVTLTATPSNGYMFVRWTGEVESTQNPLVLTADTEKFITAVFEPQAYPITYENLRGATNPNPATYREGTLVSFQNPGTVTGYTFAEWTPSQITADMTGAQTVRAAWTANSYSIAYNSNGGSGTMNATAATYDSVTNLAANGFTWTGHVFAGWATNATGEVIYAAGQAVSNLTAQSSGVVTLYAVWEDLVVAAPVVMPADGTVFTEGSCTVTLSCATEGAVIYYSPKGATPRLTDAYRYTAPFTITDTATIKAIAVVEGVRSEYVTATITKKTLSLAEAAGAAELTFTTGGDADWTPIGDVTAASGLSAQSGAIGDEAETWMQTSVSGAGTFSFLWKVDCEWDDSGDATWDHVAVFTNGVEAARMDGTSGWVPVSFAFADAGAHTIRWAFSKDDYNEETFSDRAWVSGVTWTPSGAADVVVDAGGGKTVTVPQAWLSANTARAATGTAANGRAVWECYVLGLDPENGDATNDFRIVSFPLKADGTPDLGKLVFEPPTAKWNVPGARAVIEGAATLGGEWQEVPAGGNPAFRFFRVKVALP